MPAQPKVLLSAFADEAANGKTAVEQMAVMAALGLKYYSPRFVDVTGSGEVKHVVDLSDDEYKQLSDLHEQYGMQVASIGSRLGKVKLLDVDDGSHNKYVSAEQYMETEVKSTIKAALALDAKLIRGFSFYHPQTDAPQKYVDQAVERLKEIVAACQKAGIIYALEVEANLIGQNGHLLAELARKVDSPNMVLIFDGGNLSCQNLSPVECFAEFEAMRDYIGWIHIKDYQIDSSLEWTGVVDEERLKNFVPANIGDSGHEAIFRNLADYLPEFTQRLNKMGVPGFFLELEPHLKGGGQFGGFSGPDGMGVAVRALCELLDYTHIDYDLRTMTDITKDRGF